MEIEEHMDLNEDDKEGKGQKDPLRSKEGESPEERDGDCQTFEVEDSEEKIDQKERETHRLCVF